MTITINNIQYVKTEVLRMVMNKAHHFAKNYTVSKKQAHPLGGYQIVQTPMSMRQALKRAWAEVKAAIISMEAARESAAQAAKANAEARAAYQAMTTAQQLEFVEDKLFQAKMSDTYAVWANNRSGAYNHAYVLKLEAEKARLLRLSA